MPSRVIRSDADRDRLNTFLDGQKMPYTVEVARGARRSDEQNRLQWLLLNEIAPQLQDQTVEQVRGFCKLTIGVPILRAENEIFRAVYDEAIRHLPYDSKIKLMMEPLDWSVTRKMSMSQFTRYLDGIYQYFSEQGLVLTQPKPKEGNAA